MPDQREVIWDAIRTLNGAHAEIASITQGGRCGDFGDAARIRLGALGMQLDRASMPAGAYVVQEIDTALADIRATGDALSGFIQPLETVRGVFAQQDVTFSGD